MQDERAWDRTDGQLNDSGVCWHAHGCSHAMKTTKTSALHKPVNPNVAQRGVPGFHNKIELGDGVPLAAMELDADTAPERVNTETGDQPGNTHGSRFKTPSVPDEKE